MTLTVILNIIFIPLYGLKGTAFATLLSITLYSLSKLLFVVKRMKLFPFTSKTITAFGILIGCFLLFYFWEFPFHPIINIGLKSIFVSFIYLFLNYKLKLSDDINVVMENVLRKIGF